MIQANALYKGFGKKNAIENLSCNIPSGCIYGLVGANGAGKSTLLRLIAGVYAPTSGSILVDGQAPYNSPQARGMVSFVPDESFFLPQSDLKRMAAMVAAGNPRFDDAYFRSLLDRFRLPYRQNLNTFSKGMRRQGAILLALATRPTYLLLDETFDGLDPIVRNLVKTILYETMEDNHTTCVLTSHSLRELEDTCDQLALLYKGGVVFESDVQNLKTGMFKVQIAFDAPFDRTKFAAFAPKEYSQQGRVATFLLRGDRDAVKEQLAAMNPLLLEILPLSLEEVFVHEMSALGYAFEVGEEAQTK